MENGHTTTEQKKNASARKAVTLAVSRKSVPLGTEKPASKSSSSATTATIQTATPKTLKKPELEGLKSAASGLVAVLSDWQASGGLVAIHNRQTEVEGRVVEWISLSLVAGGVNIKKDMTPNGLSILVAEDSTNG